MGSLLVKVSDYTQCESKNINILNGLYMDFTIRSVNREFFCLP